MRCPIPIMRTDGTKVPCTYDIDLTRPAEAMPEFAKHVLFRHKDTSPDDVSSSPMDEDANQVVDVTEEGVRGA